MPISHDLSGLMKFLARDEWRECFEEVFNEHFGPILDGEGEFEDLAEVVGDYWTMALWGCAFEDFLTQDFEGEPSNMVDEYLKRRGWKESAQSRAYMAALRTSVMSLYEVSDVVPGMSFMARDLVRGGEPVAVSEGTATKTLKQWDRLAARIVPVMGKNVMAGGVLPFTPQATETLFDGLRGLFGKRNAKKLPAIKDDELQAAAFMFTLSWLFDTLGRVAGPRLQNTDGDEIVFHNVRFPLVAGVKQEDIAARLDNIPALSQADVKFWNWLEETTKGRHKSKAATAPAMDTTMDNGPLVLGNVELKGRFLHLSANSAVRAARGTALIQQALGDLVRTPLTEIRTVEQMKAEHPRKGAKTSPSNILPEVAEQRIHEYLDRHYLETLDQPVKMLGNKTPRQAAKTAAGRQKVADWLKYVENQTAKQPDPAHPMATYSFGWMWKELGVHDLRR
ncbi:MULTISPECIES: hypothetical protein [unclassified Mesorhizobium]|uniref:hypothetical protein n=1 Tax=unclassified Mesorhizobium TaxID=325217 RepID=UPI000FCB7808|nr:MULTISPECIES: hypothetical protein [unclassified Mesorhizobium]TGP27299.1 hypothetical protein EN874_003220 [Mesorhizobium sp. M1D.F.Ca.ET.231.01.1.1]TGP39257.1 hypothetical protein EN877_03220 [Mesorhizobium sp. M1D.F.Ca.ET.234.01.1.1]TGS51468.1 hypothetical protein EN827_03220 [Mesorhizobium sp. M1D.F.Ca.ET.184.01.1.1]TGS67354.1 hypothetical protein EN826_003220 [Mesorhizobium sp. M1D.F.Ca.ET.183.01.1.1]